MTFAHFSKNGELLPIAEATIPFTNIEYAYGFGVYENIRVADGSPRFLPDHVERLQHSARVIGLEHPFDAGRATDAIEGLVKDIGKETYNLKVLLIGASKPEQSQLIVLPLSPLFPDRKLYRDGAKAVSFEHERLFPQAKTLNMFPSYYFYRKAKAAGCYDALFVDRDGNILEGTRTNFFSIRGRTLYSPPVEKILEGVTRKHVLQVANSMDFEILEDDVPLREISKYDGTFLTSTSSKIMPLGQIDDYQFPAVPQALKELMEGFEGFLRTL